MGFDRQWLPFGRHIATRLERATERDHQVGQFLPGLAHPSKRRYTPYRRTIEVLS